MVLAAPSARAADECRGLPVCIPVAGPWVVIPPGDADARFPQRSWRMKCPEGSIVGGVDARLTHRAVDMSFSGLLGSPVNPGITTTGRGRLHRDVHRRRLAADRVPPLHRVRAHGGRRPHPDRRPAPSAVKPGGRRGSAFARCRSSTPSRGSRTAATAVSDSSRRRTPSPCARAASRASPSWRESSRSSSVAPGVSSRAQR